MEASCEELKVKWNYNVNKINELWTKIKIIILNKEEVLPILLGAANMARRKVKKKITEE